MQSLNPEDLVLDVPYLDQVALLVFTLSHVVCPPGSALRCEKQPLSPLSSYQSHFRLAFGLAIDILQFEVFESDQVHSAETELSIAV